MSSRKMWAFGTGVVLFVVVSLARAVCFDLKGFALFQNAFGGPGACGPRLHSFVGAVPSENGAYGEMTLREAGEPGFVATDFVFMALCRWGSVRLFEKHEDGSETLRIAADVTSKSLHLNSGIVFNSDSELLMRWQCYDGVVEVVTVSGVLE